MTPMRGREEEVEWRRERTMRRAKANEEEEAIDELLGF